MLKKLSLQKRLSFSIITIFAISLFAMTFYGFNKSSELIRKEAFFRADEMAQKYALQIQATLDEAFITTRTTARIFQTMRDNGPISREVAFNIQNKNLEDLPFLYGTGSYWEPNGVDGNDVAFIGGKQNSEPKTGRFIPWVHRSDKGFVTESSNPEEMSQPGVGDWYLIPKNTMKEALIQPYLYPIADGSKIIITSPTTPIIIAGKFYGIYQADIRLDEIEKIVATIRPYDDGFAELISGDAKYVATPEKKLIDQPVPKEEAHIFEILKTGKMTSFEKNNFYHVAVPIKIGQTGKFWVLQVDVPISKVLAGIKTLAMVQGSLALISLFLISIVIYFLSLGISKPLTNQNRAVESVASTLQTSSEHLLVLSKSLSDSSTSQSSALLETSSAMDQINAMVSKNNDAAKKSKEAANRSQQSAEEGRNATEQMVRSMEEIKDSSHKISTQSEKGNQEIEEIIKIIHSIEEKTKVINEIVFQTKLLSFNASVEAARAGENGKGFAIVAEEVANLAQMSGKASLEITELLQSSSGKVSQIIEANNTAIKLLIKDSTEKVERGIISVQEFKEKLKDIVVNSEAVGVLVEEIVDASGQQTLGVAEVTRAINDLDAEAQKNSSIAKEASNAAEKVNENSDELKIIVGKLDELMSGQRAS